MMEEDQGWLPNAPVVMAHDNNRIEESTNSHIALNIQQTPTIYILYSLTCE